MAKCSLSIDLDHPANEPLVPGETLTGEVVVEVDKDVKCRKLTVDFCWRTHGSGNRASGAANRLVLHQGPWKAGEYIRYPFEFTVPSGPNTYHGHHLNVDWFITANADIPWAFDPKAEIDLLMDTSGSGSYDHGPRFKPGFSPNSTVTAVFQSVIGVFFLFPTVFSCFGVFAIAEEGLIGIPFMLFPLIFTAVGTWLLFTAWRSKIAETLLGKVELEIPDEVYPGETFDILLHCEPKRSVNLTALVLELNGKEVVVRGSGTNRTTYTHEVHKSVHRMEEGRTIEAGEHAVFAHQFTVPSDAGPSFAASDNALNWTVDVRFDIPRFPDWLGAYTVAVRPKSRG